MNPKKSYSELLTLPDFEQRFKYLSCKGIVGAETFGSYRFLNQRLYSSPEWRNFRNKIIVRDNGCEMALDGYPIAGSVYLHHINPLTIYDIENHTDTLYDPENIICVSFNLHQAIHYESLDFIKGMYNIVERRPNDTCPWLD